MEQKAEAGRRKGSRFDRQMDRITKMLETSTNELAGATFQAPSGINITYRLSEKFRMYGQISRSNKLLEWLVRQPYSTM